MGLGRLELPTSPLSGARSSQLSYKPVRAGSLTVAGGESTGRNPTHWGCSHHLPVLYRRLISAILAGLDRSGEAGPVCVAAADHGSRPGRTGETTLGSFGVFSAAPGLAAVCGVALSAAAGGQPAPKFEPRHGERLLTGRLLVRPVQPQEWRARGLEPSAASRRSAAAAARLAPDRLSLVEALDIHVVAVPAGQTEESFAASLMAGGEYQYVEPDWLLLPQDTTPNDPGLEGQWHHRKIQSRGAWDLTTGDGSIVCAFVDTGVDTQHEDLAANLVPGCNAVTRVSQLAGGLVTDVSGHGTQVAGVAAAAGNNLAGGSGIGWDLKIMPIRASNWSSGSAFLSDVLWGASWAAAQGARVITVSYAGADTSSAEVTGQSIMDQRNGLLFWAAGNTAARIAADPPHVVIVGATDRLDARLAESNWGPGIDVVAPGADLYTTKRDGGYTWVRGTSYSSPIAAAAVAVTWSMSPGLTPYQMLDRLEQTCADLGATGDDEVFGRGRVNVYRLARAVDSLGLGEQGSVVLPPIGAPAVSAGVVERWFDSRRVPPGAWSFSGLSHVGAGVVPGLSLPQPPPGPGLGVQYEGVVTVDDSGPYTFRLTGPGGANHGAIVTVDGLPVVWSLGLPAGASRSGTVRLLRGTHRIVCSVFAPVTPPVLSLTVRGGSLIEGPVEPSALGHLPTIPRLP